jgi:beta-N-acetylhexosaminidase
VRASGEDILGQLLLQRVGGPRWSASFERALRGRAPGGILLVSPLPRTPESVGEILGKAARALPVPPFLALEEEGGARDPLRAFFPPLPSPRAVAERGPAVVARLGELAGEGLELLGFNTNLAPLLDLGALRSEGALATRAFSSDAQQVARCGTAFVRGLRRHKVLACAKHFPGLGSASSQNQFHLPVIGKSMAELWREDLVPFRELLPDLPLLMVSAAAYKAYDFNYPRPAAHSAQVSEGLLRIKLGYGGVAVAPELASEAARGNLDVGEAAVQAVRAGCDLLVVDGEESCEAIRQALATGLESGRLSSARCAQALERVRVAKKHLEPPSGKISRRAVDQLARRFADFAKEFRSEELNID